MHYKKSLSGGWVMRSQRMLLLYIKWILALSFLFPFAAFAHVISITAVTPFPAQIRLGVPANASYIVANISPHTTVTVIDQSKFPKDSGLAITSSTCGSPMGPGATC